MEKLSSVSLSVCILCCLHVGYKDQSWEVRASLAQSLLCCHYLVA